MYICDRCKCVVLFAGVGKIFLPLKILHPTQPLYGILTSDNAEVNWNVCAIMVRGL